VTSQPTTEPQRALPPSSPAAAAVADSCGKLVRGFARVKSQLLALTHDDVDWSAHLLITQLAGEGPMRLSALAELVHADPSTVSRQVATLVRDGYVERRADPVDGRASLLVVTEQGQRLYSELMRLRTEFYQRMLADWTDDQCHEFAALAARLTTGIDQVQLPWFERPSMRRIAPAGTAAHD
jgi:DNA-binding MarR family transcriptional regulator